MSGILAGRWRRRDFTVAALGFACAGAAAIGGSPGNRVVGAAVGSTVPAVVALTVGRQGQDTRSSRRSRPADVVTFVRAGLAGCAVAAALRPEVGGARERSWPVAVLAVSALALDAVDGVVARATDSGTPAGARLDMQTDSAVFALLSCVAARAVTPWALAIGGARYLFVAGRLVRPAWGGALPPSRRRRVVAGCQGVALGVALVPVTPMTVARVGLHVAAVALAASFAADIVALERAAAVGRRGPEAVHLAPRPVVGAVA